MLSISSLNLDLPDYQEEEQLFCQQEIQKTPKKEEKKAPKEISILDGKTSMNVNIFLRQFKGTWLCVPCLV